MCIRCMRYFLMLRCVPLRVCVWTTRWTWTLAGIVGPLKRPVLVGWGHLTRDRTQREAADQTVFCLTGGDKETVSLASEQSRPSPLSSLPASDAGVNQKVGNLWWMSKECYANIHHYKTLIVSPWSGLSGGFYGWMDNKSYCESFINGQS